MDDPTPDITDLASARALIATLQAELGQAQRENARLRQQLDVLCRRLFGKKSEKVDPRQLQLALDQLANEPGPVTEPVEMDSGETPVREHTRHRAHGRQVLPAHLPRAVVTIDIAEADKVCACGAHKVVIGTTDSEKLDYVPASFRIVQTSRPKYACPACHDGVAEAPAPPQAVEKSLAAEGLLAQVVVSKYADHLPLHRLEGIFARSGVTLARSTLCDWVADVRDVPLERVPLLEEEGTAWLVTRAFGAVPLPQLGNSVLRYNAAPDAHVLVYGCLATLIAAAAVGFASSRQVSQVAPLRELAVGGTTVGGPSRGSRIQRVLVGAQMAGSIVLLVAAGLFIRTSLAGVVIRPGFDVDHTALGHFHLGLTDGHVTLDPTPDLGISNSRMKDFSDVAVAARRIAFDGATLVRALRATFHRRGTAFPDGDPVPLTQRFVQDAIAQANWNAFAGRTETRFESLGHLVSALRQFLREPLQRARSGDDFTMRWNAGGPWA